MYVSNSATPSATFFSGPECAWIRLRSIMRPANRSRASSVFPCQSRCFTLSRRFDTSAPVAGPLLLQSLRLLLQHGQPHGDVEPVNQVLAEKMLVLLHPAYILAAIGQEHHL